jgi:nicotinamidase-related amidase
MPVSPVLVPSHSVFLAIDLQERLLANMESSSELVAGVDLMQHVCHLLQVPVVHLMQRPDVLGAVHSTLAKGEIAATVEKKAFSPFAEDGPRRFLESFEAEQWVLCGIESHVCVLQTARDLLRMGKHVVVLADACASFSIYDYASALSELRHEGARVCSIQTLIFDWLKRSDHPAFKTILQWVKQMNHASGIGFSSGCGCSEGEKTSCGSSETKAASCCLSHA